MNSAEVGEVWQDNLLWPSSNKKSSPINSSNFHKDFNQHLSHLNSYLEPDSNEAIQEKHLLYVF